MTSPCRSLRRQKAPGPCRYRFPPHAAKEAAAPTAKREKPAQHGSRACSHERGIGKAPPLASANRPDQGRQTYGCCSGTGRNAIERAGRVRVAVPSGSASRPGRGSTVTATSLRLYDDADRRAVNDHAGALWTVGRAVAAVRIDASDPSPGKIATTVRRQAQYGNQRAYALRMVGAIRIGTAVGLKALANEAPRGAYVGRKPSRSADAAGTVGVRRASIGLSGCFAPIASSQTALARWVGQDPVAGPAVRARLRGAFAARGRRWAAWLESLGRRTRCTHRE